VTATPTLTYGQCQHCRECSVIATLSARVGELEKAVKQVHAPAIDELDDRVDEHDRRFARVEATLDRLTNAVTRQSLVLEGVDKKLLAIVKALGVEEAANG
jgi:uncharacterized coiled-coil protein SlyX